MSNTFTPGHLIEEVKGQLYTPTLTSDQESQSVATFIDSKDGKEHYRFSMYHLLVANYIVNGVFSGKISAAEKQRLIKIGSSREGLEKLSAHVIMSYSGTYNQYESVNIVNEIVCIAGDTVLDTKFIPKH